VDSSNVTAVTNLSTTVVSSATGTNDTSAGTGLITTYVEKVAQTTNTTTVNTTTAQTIITALSTVVNSNTSSLISPSTVDTTIQTVKKLLDTATASGDVQTALQNIGTVVDGLITVQQTTSDAQTASALRELVQDTLLSSLNSTTNVSVQISSPSFSAYATVGTPQQTLAVAGIDVPSSIVTSTGTDISNSPYDALSFLSSFFLYSLLSSLYLSHSYLCRSLLLSLSLSLSFSLTRLISFFLVLSPL
jgi:hypothetical protein